MTTMHQRMHAHALSTFKVSSIKHYIPATTCPLQKALYDQVAQFQGMSLGGPKAVTGELREVWFDKSNVHQRQSQICSSTHHCRHHHELADLRVGRNVQTLFPHLLSLFLASPFWEIIISAGYHNMRIVSHAHTVPTTVVRWKSTENPYYRR